MGGIGRQAGVESEQWPGDLSFNPYPPYVITVHLCAIIHFMKCFHILTYSILTTTLRYHYYYDPHLTHEGTMIFQMFCSYLH